MPTMLRNSAKKIVLSLFYRLPPFPQQIHGKFVWVHPRARLSISTNTFFKGESHVRKWLIEQLKPGHVFFDVGAHHGWVSMLALSLVGQGGAVYSFEPSPANLSILEWHRKKNSFSQWIIVPNAVANEDAIDKQFFLIDSGDSPMNSLTSGIPGMPLMEGRSIENISVHTVTLDTICEEFGVKPDLVKIDVEGAELLVLLGAKKLLCESSPSIILAVHPYWLPSGQLAQQIFELLSSNGYTMFNSLGSPVEYFQSGEYFCLSKKARSKALI